MIGCQIDKEGRTTESKARKAITGLLCAVLATSPLLGGCAANAQKPEQDGSESDALVRDADEELESQSKKVPYDKTGAYIVTLKESDFQKPEDGQGDEAVPTDDQGEAPEAESDVQKPEGEQGDEATSSDDQEKASDEESEKASDGKTSRCQGGRLSGA